MLNIPKILHFTVPAQTSKSQEQCIQRARDLHKNWQIMVWQDPVDPSPFELSHLWEKSNSGAQLADLIRIEAVYLFGGVYLDSDIWVERPLDDFCKESTFFLGTEDGQRATNAAFGATPRHPALRSLIERIGSDATFDWSRPPNETTGPELFSRELRWNSEVMFLPRETFYPYNWNEKPCAPQIWSYGTHKWSHSWKALSDRRSPLHRFLRAEHYVRAIEIIKRRIKTSEVFVRAFTPNSSWYTASARIVKTTIYGFKIILAGSDYSITPEVAMNGYYELREELFLRSILRGGDWFIDVGANVGLFSLLAGTSVGPFGRVFAFEPNPVPRELLKISTVMNWMHDRIQILPCAIGSTVGSSKLRFAEESLGGASLPTKVSVSMKTQAEERLSGMQEIEVDLSTLDIQFPINLPIKALKIDAEGHELDILRGADRLLRNRCIEYIIMELIDDMLGDTQIEIYLCLEQIRGYGYEFFVLELNSKLRQVDLADRKINSAGRNIIIKRM